MKLLLFVLISGHMLKLWINQKKAFAEQSLEIFGSKYQNEHAG